MSSITQPKLAAQLQLRLDRQRDPDGIVLDLVLDDGRELRVMVGSPLVPTAGAVETHWFDFVVE